MPKIAAATVAEHRLRTWTALLDAIDSLVLERPFESISMRDVAARARVARTAIYNYAPDTVTLLIEATRRAGAEMRTAVARGAEDTSIPPRQRLREIVTVLLVDFPRSTSTLLAGQAIERTLRHERLTEAITPFRTEIGVYVMDVIRAGIDAGEFTPVADPQLTLRLMVGVMQSAIHKIADTSTNSSAVADVAAQFLINALSGPAPISTVLPVTEAEPTRATEPAPRP